MENSEEKLLNTINRSIQKYTLKQNIRVTYTIDNPTEVTIRLYELGIKINLFEKKIYVALGSIFPHEELNYSTIQSFSDDLQILECIVFLLDISENRLTITQWIISQFLLDKHKNFKLERVDTNTDTIQGIIYVNICFDKDNFTYEITILEEQTEVRVFDKNEDYYFSTVEPTLVSTKVDDILAFLSSLF